MSLKNWKKKGKKSNSVIITELLKNPKSWIILHGFRVSKSRG